LGCWACFFGTAPGPALSFSFYDKCILLNRTRDCYPFFHPFGTTCFSTLHLCSRSWSTSRASAVPSRRSHSACSYRVSRRSRVRYRPQVRTSSTSNSSRSRSIQHRTPLERLVIGHLLKTRSPMFAHRRTKSKYYFRLAFALIYPNQPSSDVLQPLSSPGCVVCPATSTRSSNRTIRFLS
jgi:hypothetical protein